MKKFNKLKIIKDKYQMLVENKLLSDVLRDVGSVTPPPKMINDKKTGELFERSVYEKSERVLKFVILNPQRFGKKHFCIDTKRI